jgi:signal transduction histidine kinase
LARVLRPTLIATATLAAAVTIVVSSAHVDVAYRSPEGHVAIETAAALISLLVAFIVLGRFMQGGRRTDLLLAAALAILGLTNLFFGALPVAIGDGFTHWATWAAVGGRLLGAFAFAAAAVSQERIVRNPRASLMPLLIAVVGALGAIALLSAFVADNLPLGIDPAMSPTRTGRTLIEGHAGVLVLQVVTFVFYSVATVGYLLKAERMHDRLMGWVAVASTLAAVASLNYFLFPSLYSEWVYTGDFLRFGFFAMLLLGAASEIQHYQSSLASAAALEERRRLARELHDGLAQELAFIATQTRWLTREPDSSQRIEQLVMAAERALDESRSAISALTRPLDEPLDAAVAQAAEDVAGRVGVRLRLALEEGIDVPPSTRAALVRIVREAVSNTARHGEATTVSVALRYDDGVRLRVEDDGIGFDPEDKDGRGFGLTSMSERARALGGELRLNSAPGAGTAIEVVIP